MSNYTKTTDFAALDALSTGNAAKIIKGELIDDEFNAIAVAVASKAETGTTTFTSITLAGTTTVTGTVTGASGIIDGGTYTG